MFLQVLLQPMLQVLFTVECCTVSASVCLVLIVLEENYMF